MSSGVTGTLGSVMVLFSKTAVFGWALLGGSLAFGAK